MKLLVDMAQPYATDAAIKLFNSPAAPAGDPAPFATALNKNLPLARKLFPAIIPLTKDTTAALKWAYLLVRLLDSNYIT